MKHFISAEQLDHPQVEDFFLAADHMRAQDQGSVADRRALASRHFGRQFISLFYEESTRTRLSFEVAAAKLGIQGSSTPNAAKFSSAAKGETLRDTVLTLREYNTDVLFMRHYETGAAAQAVAAEAESEEMAHASGSFYRPLSIINAGDGKGEHPTQALLDAYTINRHAERLDDLDIVLGGDLRQGRTARSLAKLLATYPDNAFTFVSAPGFEMGDDIKQFLDDHGTPWQETTDMHGAVKEADVVYWTRLQRERLAQQQTNKQRLAAFFKQVTGLDITPLMPSSKPAMQDSHYVIENSVVESMRPDAILMHPLPRVDEITTDVDKDPRAAYFRQAGNGMYVRMALLDFLLQQNS